MSTFQILTLIISGLFLLSGIVTVYIANRVALAEVKLQIKNIERELLQKEIASLLSEKNNREDHFRIMDKLDRVIESLEDKKDK
jgi:hypothetical protein